MFSFPTFDLQKHRQDLPEKGRILVAPLYWGLGHATRCIPIISQLLENGYEPVIASDGMALALLRKQFPQLKHYELPDYDISYAKNPLFFGLKLAWNFSKILKIKKLEHLKTKEIVEQENIVAIISDNRFGVNHPKITSIYITHQLQIQPAINGYIASKWHQKVINSFDVCWIPDVEGTPNLSGNLSHKTTLKIPKRYIGMLSIHKKETLPIQFDVLLLLSGPEPQRTIWEHQLKEKYKQSHLKICMIRGVVEEHVQKEKFENITVYNFLVGKELQNLLNSSRKVISRSGYSTVMDLVALEKEAELVPTPYQPEQEYLAKYLKKSKIFD